MINKLLIEPSNSLLSLPSLFLNSSFFQALRLGHNRAAGSLCHSHVRGVHIEAPPCGDLESSLILLASASQIDL